MPKFFVKENYVLHYKNLKIYLWLELKLKKILHVLEFNQSQWIKPYDEFNAHTKKRIEREKNGKKDEKSNLQINEQCYVW